MKLFTKDINAKLFKQYPMGSNLEKQFVVAKVFNPYGEGRWFLLNSDPEDPDYLWAIVQMNGEVEMGSVSRKELETLKVGRWKLPLERDLGFSPINAAQLMSGLREGKFYKNGGWVEYANGGVVKWQDAQIGDNARVIAENKTGLIMQAYGRKFHLKFVDGSEKTYDAKELEFFTDEEFGKGGSIKKDFKVGDKVIYSRGGKWFVRKTANFKEGVVSKIETISGSKLYTIERKNSNGVVIETFQSSDTKEIDLNPNEEFEKGGEIVGYEVEYEKTVDGEKERDIKNFTNKEDAEKFAKENYSRVDNVYEGQYDYAKGGIVVTSIKDIPNFKERLEEGKITYRGLGMGKLSNDFYKIAGTAGTRIKVDGKEYYITDVEFDTFNRGADGKMRVRFDAPARRGYADGGELGADKHKIYFSSFAEVMDAINDIAEENGYKVVDIFPDLSYGGVSYGQTKRAKVELEWDGKEKRGKSKKREKNTLNVQIYRMDSGNYELNTYFAYAEGGMMAKGGVTFSDKVSSIKSSLLKRKKVSPSVQKDYGKTYSPKEAVESAKRIAGAMTAKERLMAKRKK